MDRIRNQAGKPERVTPLFTPEMRGNEWTYVKECLDTTWVSSAGSYVDRFERELAEYVGVEHAVATINGTSALHIALICAGVQPDDEVLVSTLTFIASANSVRYVGGVPVFIDAEPKHWQMDPNLVEEFLKRRCFCKSGSLYNRDSGRRVSAVMPVHVLGHPVDLDPILKLARRYELPVVEDAAEGLGAKYKGRRVGGLADIGCLSFNGNKLITTGGGGALLTNDDGIAERARYLTTQAKDDPLEYVHGDLGYNYRLTNVLAAIGCAQMEQLDGFIKIKRRTAEVYQQHLRDVEGVEFFTPSADAFCTFWMNTVRISEADYGADSRTLLRRLGERGIQTRPLWQPMHASPVHGACRSLLTGVADRLSAECLNVPSSVGLSESDVIRVCGTVADLRRADLGTGFGRAA